MFDSVRMRMTLWHVGVLALLLSAFCAFAYALLTHDLYDRLDDVSGSVLDATVSMLAKELSEPGLKDQAPADALKALNFPEYALAIFDEHGRLVAEKPAGASMLAPLPKEKPLVLGTVSRFELNPGGEDDSPRRRVAAIRVNFALAERTYQIVLSQSLDQVFLNLEAFRRVLYIAVPAALLLAGFGGWFLARKSLAPVVEMAEQARRIGGENMSERLQLSNPRDELGRLGSTLNELLDRLSASFAQQREFMADASHELRTPISVIRTAASVTLSQERRDEEEYRGVLTMIDEQGRHLARIVEDMFRLARADSGNQNVRVNRFYLDELLAKIVCDAKLLGAAKDIRIELSETGEAPIDGDEELIRQMILNLIDNAVKYAPAGARVRMSLEQRGEEYVVSVSDTGPGIPVAAQTRIFERFYRVDSVHSLSREDGPLGAGLGLPIARWVAEAHRGRLVLERSDESGSTFVAVLPVPKIATEAARGTALVPADLEDGASNGWRTPSKL